MQQYSLILIVCFALAVIFFLLRSIYYHRQLRQLHHQLDSSQQAVKITTDHKVELVAEITTLKDQIAETQLRDTLTGLPTRVVFEDRLRQAIMQSERYKLVFAVMAFNLDGFKIVNGVLGYEAGDEILKEIANRLLVSVRQVDTACRFSGDQFYFILPQLAKSETAAFIAKRFLDEVSLPFYVHQQELFVTACIGIAIYPSDGTDAKILLKNADNALQQAKMRGRNSYQFYSEEMHALSRRELLLNTSLHRGNIFQEFLVYYHPALDFSGKKIFCMEALLRWQHPDFGLIAPKEFLRLAENSGKSIEIDEWVLRHACTQFKKWQAVDFNPKYIAVNISLHQLENPHFSYRLSQILQETELDPGCLILEISEGTLFSKFDLIEKTLYMLKNIGVKIAIDNFGTGRLSLQHLKRFPVDFLKIDHSLTQDILTNKESVIIIKMIIALVKSLQIEVIAEGVESQNQKETLLELGCHILQGHLFSHPALPEEFPSAINNMLLTLKAQTR